MGAHARQGPGDVTRPARRAMRWAASATGGALMTVLTIALTLGALAVAVPPGVAQVVPSTTPTVAARPGCGAGTTSGSQVLAMESPATDQQVHTDRDFLLVGYALDKSATINQGSQGSGIDRVQLFMDDTRWRTRSWASATPTPRRRAASLPTAAFG